MTCPELAVLQGRVWPPEIGAHVGNCGSCRLVMELIDERSQAAASHDRRAECARFEALIAVRVEAELHGAAASMLERHLRECVDCRALAQTMAPVADVVADHASLPAVDPAAYALGSEIGRGGMGRILAARDLRIGRPVAVKELLAKNAALATRFEREARVTARLQHPGIVPIYEIGRWENGTPFYTMRMVEGKTLRAALAGRETLDARLALLPSVLAAAETIAFAHAHQVIHRDLTPSNIMVGEYGETVVIDWGLAKDLSVETNDDADIGPYRRDPTASADLTAAGAVIGTASYMPPEQAAGARVDERADIYALGAILYHLLAGHAPYKGTSEQVLQAVKCDPPGPLATSVPRDLASIVSKAMARQPGDRYTSAKQLAAELAAFQAGRLVGAHEYTRGELLRRWIRKRRGVVAAVSLALVALGVFALFAVRRIIEERDSADTERVIAQQQRSQSDSLSITLLAEQGRQELLGGNALRALPYLSAAYSQGDASVEMRFMLAAAMRSIDARERVLGGGSSREIQELALSPDGEQVLAIKADTIETWNVASGAMGPTLHADSGVMLTEAAYSPDGKTIAAIAGDQQNRWPEIFVFDVATGKLRKLTGHTHSSTRPLFTPDGKYLLTVSWDGTWRRWDLATGEARIVKMAGPPRYGRDGPVGAGAPALDQDGERLLTMNWQGNLEMWSVETGARIWTLSSYPTYSVSLHPDGTRVLTCNLDEAILWDVATSKVIARRAGPGFHMVHCSFEPDGKGIVLAGDSGEVAVWDERLARQQATLHQHGGMIRPIHVGRDRLVIPNEFGGGGLGVWDIGLQAQSSSIEEVGKLVVASADGRRIATSRSDGRVEVWRIDRGHLRRRFTTADIKEPNVSLDGSRVVSRPEGGELRLHDVDRGGELVPIPALHAPFDLAGGRVAAASNMGEVVIIDDSGSTVGHFTATSSLQGIQLTEDGSRVLVTYAASSEVRDSASGRLLATIPVACKVAMIAGDGSRVALLAGSSGTADHLVVWDVQRARELHRIPLEGHVLFDLVFVSRDGRRIGIPYLLNSGLNERNETVQLVIYDADSGRALVKVPQAVFPAFAATTDRIFVSGVNGLLHVLRYRDGEVLARLPILPRFAVAQVTADGRRLALTNTDGTSEVLSASDARPLYRFAMRPVIPQLDPDARQFGYSMTIANGFNGIRDDLFVSGNENGSAIATWDIHLETRTPPEIATLVEERAPWRIEAGRLVRRDL